MSDDRKKSAQDYELFKIGVINANKTINFEGYMAKCRENQRLLGFVWDANGDPREEGRRLLYGVEMGTSHSGIAFYITSGEFTVTRPVGYGFYAEDHERPGKMVQWTLEDVRCEIFECPYEMNYGVMIKMSKIKNDAMIDEILDMDAMKTADDIITDMSFAWRTDNYDPIIRAM